MKKIRAFLPFVVVVICLFLQWSPSNASISTKTTLKVAGFQPFVAMQPVTFVASVVPLPGHGLVIFSAPNSSALTQTGGQVDSQGRATVTIEFLPGIQSIHAQFQGFGIFAPSTSPFISFQVVKAFAGTSLTSTNPNITYGDPISFNVTITPIAPSVPNPGIPPTGTITFYDGSSVIAFGNLANANLTFNGYLFSIGTHNIVAEYSGDSNFMGSESPQTIVVNVTAP